LPTIVTTVSPDMNPPRKAAVPTHLGCHRPAVVDTARQTFAANCNRAGRRRRSSAPAASTPDQPKERRGKESAQRNPTGRVQCPSHRENREDHYSETPKPRDEQSPQQRPHETALPTYVRDVTVGPSTDNNDFVRQATACHRTPLVGGLACSATCDTALPGAAPVGAFQGLGAPEICAGLLRDGRAGPVVEAGAGRGLAGIVAYPGPRRVAVARSTSVTSAGFSLHRSGVGAADRRRG